MTTRLIAQCQLCAHWVSPLDRDDQDAQKRDPTQICAAYPLPDGIPDEIWWNRVDHRAPHEGDHGMRWTAHEGAEFPEYALE